MVSQGLYDNVVDDVLSRLQEEGLQIRSFETTIYAYQGGAWALMSNSQLGLTERLMYEASHEHSLSFAEKKSGLWNTFKAKVTENTMSDIELDKHVLIACPNGTLDPYTGTLKDHDPDDYTTRRIAIEYHPRAKCPEWLAMLERCMPDKDERTREAYIDFLQEFYGMALCGFNERTPRDLRKALILYGASGTAKTSGIADTLREFFHAHELCSENVDQLSSAFGLQSLAHARALISDDAISSRSRPDPNILKKLITGEPMTANRKYKEAQGFRFRGPVVFTTNNKPKIDDESDALFNRTVLLTFDYVFQPEDKKLLKGMTPVAFLHSKKEFPGILNWALAGMIRARENGRYTSIDEADVSNKAWRAENDPTFALLTRYGVPDKTSFVHVPLLARMVNVYSEEEFDKKTTIQTASLRIRREASKLIKGARVERADDGSEMLVGVKFSSDGVIWEKRARSRGKIPEGVKWQVNGKTI